MSRELVHVAKLAEATEQNRNYQLQCKTVKSEICLHDEKFTKDEADYCSIIFCNNI